MKIFINNLEAYVGRALCHELQQQENENDENEKNRNEICATVENENEYDDVKDLNCKILKRMPKKDFLLELLSCDVLIFSLTNCDEEDMEFIISTLAKRQIEKDIRLIVISSLLLWTNTAKVYSKPEENTDEAEEEDETEKEEDAPPPELLPFDDASLSTRTPSRRYQKWSQYETLVMALSARPNVQSLVIGAGVLYGDGEETFHEMFKNAWLTLPKHFIIGTRGDNIVPTLHVRDLASVIKIATDTDTDLENEKYWIAVDTGKHTQEDIVYSIITEFSDKYEVPSIDIPECLETMSRVRVDELTCDLFMKPCNAMMSESFPWWCKEGLISNINKMAIEFRHNNKLRPIKVVVLGPPACGKTFFAKMISEAYNTPYLATADVIHECCQQEDELSAEINAALQIKTDKKSKEKAPAAPRLSIEHMSEIFRRKLRHGISRHRGYVLDGFPRNFQEATHLFKPIPVHINQEEQDEETEEQDNEDESEEKPQKQKQVQDVEYPDSIILIESSSENCRNRLLDLPETATHATHNNEKDFDRRTKEFKEQNMNDLKQSVIEYFQIKGLQILDLQVDGLSSEGVMANICLYMERNGRPFNYLRAPEEIQAEVNQQLAAIEAEEGARLAAEAEAEQQELETKFHDRLAEEDGWLTKIAEHERLAAEAKSLPLRHYLMTHVVPTLSKGLLEVTSVKPDDPIDFLANYLFQHADEANTEEAKQDLTAVVAGEANSKE